MKWRVLSARSPTVLAPRRCRTPLRAVAPTSLPPTVSKLFLVSGRNEMKAVLFRAHGEPVIFRMRIYLRPTVGSEMCWFASGLCANHSIFGYDKVILRLSPAASSCVGIGCSRIIEQSVSQV